MEAREASADLLFALQPLIVAHPGFAAKMVDVLRRCGAVALLRRFSLAAYGGSTGIVTPLTYAADPSGQYLAPRAFSSAKRQSPTAAPIAGLAKLDQ